MIRIIRGNDWCEVIDNGTMIYAGHNMNDALEAYLDYHDIRHEEVIKGLESETTCNNCRYTKRSSPFDEIYCSLRAVHIMANDTCEYWSEVKR